MENTIRQYILLALILGFVIALIKNLELLAVVFFCLYFIIDLGIELIQMKIEERRERDERNRQIN
jgi:ABC-type amino acid transport system permease subunit